MRKPSAGESTAVGMPMAKTRGWGWLCRWALVGACALVFLGAVTRQRQGVDTLEEAATTLAVYQAEFAQRQGLARDEGERAAAPAALAYESLLTIAHAQWVRTRELQGHLRQSGDRRAVLDLVASLRQSAARAKDALHLVDDPHVSVQSQAFQAYLLRTAQQLERQFAPGAVS